MSTDNEFSSEDQLNALKSRADLLGVKYHPSISYEKLQEKIAAANQEQNTQDTPASEVKESENAKRLRMKKEAMKLVRVRVTCMNPYKNELEGDLFTAGNSVVGTVSRYIPFNAEDGWHIEQILYDQLKNRVFQSFYTTKDSRGNKVRKGKLVKEYAIEVLPPLTKEELAELAVRQAATKAID